MYLFDNVGPTKIKVEHEMLSITRKVVEAGNIAARV